MKLYQNIKIPGQKLVYEDKKRENSKFWGEGKWNNFIEPLLLPQDCRDRTFIEIGSNAGMFLKKAEDKGFARVIGIESHPARLKEAEAYRKSNKGRYEIIPQVMEQKFNFGQLPLAHVTLIANTHYYLSVTNFSRVVDALWNRSLYCIVVSAMAKRITGCARYDLTSVRGYFKNWQEVRVIENLDMDGDPSPRNKMFGILFKGGLEEYTVKFLHDKWRKGNIGSEKYRRDAIPDAIDEFYEKVLSKKEFDMKDTAYYKYWQKRRPDQTDAWIRKKLGRKARLAKSVRDKGLYDPIFLSETYWRYGNGKLIDGQHRLCIANALGLKTILVRTL